MSEGPSVQQLSLEERRLTATIDQVYRELLTLERAMAERRMALTTIEEDLKEPLTEKQVLVPIGGEVFLYAATSSLDRVLVNIGSGIFMVRKKEEAQRLLETKLETFQKALQERNALLQDMRRRRDGIAVALREYQARTQRQG